MMKSNAAVPLTGFELQRSGRSHGGLGGMLPLTPKDLGNVFVGRGLDGRTYKGLSGLVGACGGQQVL